MTEEVQNPPVLSIIKEKNAVIREMDVLANEVDDYQNVITEKQQTMTFMRSEIESYDDSTRHMDDVEFANRQHNIAASRLTMYQLIGLIKFNEEQCKDTTIQGVLSLQAINHLKPFHIDTNSIDPVDICDQMWGAIDEQYSSPDANA